MDWLIERCITAEASIHVNDVSLGDVRLVAIRVT
jgi:hypothetical protein